MLFFDHDFADALDEIFEIEKPQKILLVTGNSSYDTSPLHPYFEDIMRRITVIRYSGLGSNPQYDRVVQAIEDLKDADFDLVIGVGGGSIIDYAKLLALYLVNKKRFYSDFTDVQDLRALSPIVAIPTTAGTGSEATHFAVLYKDGKKYSIATDEMLPGHVIIDPKLTYTMNPHLTATTGMDALCQAIESLWARGATPKSKEYAITALRYIVPNIESAVISPDAHSRRAMAIGAYYAGKAINISKTTGPHAFSYYLTHQFGVTHGEAVAMTMKLFIELNYPYVNEDVRSIYLDVFGVQSVEEFMTNFHKLQKKIGLRESVRDAGIKNKEELKMLIDSVNMERMTNNPAPIDVDKVVEFFKIFFDE